jgi:hypothetical protein
MAEDGQSFFERVRGYFRPAEAETSTEYLPEAPEPDGPPVVALGRWHNTDGINEEYRELVVETDRGFHPGYETSHLGGEGPLTHSERAFDTIEEARDLAFAFYQGGEAGLQEAATVREHGITWSEYLDQHPEFPGRHEAFVRDADWDGPGSYYLDNPGQEYAAAADFIARLEIERGDGSVDGLLERHPDMPPPYAESWLADAEKLIHDFREAEPEYRAEVEKADFLDRNPDFPGRHEVFSHEGNWDGSGQYYLVDPARDYSAAADYIAKVETLHGDGSVDGLLERHPDMPPAYAEQWQATAANLIQDFREYEDGYREAAERAQHASSMTAALVDSARETWAEIQSLDAGPERVQLETAFVNSARELPEAVQDALREAEPAAMETVSRKEAKVDVSDGHEL